ncbi:hypothetical protein N8T08_002370 [Aspergillus melleus]|uniref:Uncharacterized protein n=1 Tax=Aspergillus melleus TaxID=138277 RepID=A0ACC3AMN6_9EURO|nr:hypothetical protein N8T08_002370 [Aspergillus melleus]
MPRRCSRTRYNLSLDESHLLGVVGDTCIVGLTAHLSCRRFFELPLSEKLKIQHPPAPMPNRGYSYVGQENLGNEGDDLGRADTAQ